MRHANWANPRLFSCGRVVQSGSRLNLLGEAAENPTVQRCAGRQCGRQSRVKLPASRQPAWSSVTVVASYQQPPLQMSLAAFPDTCLITWCQ
jgi:hypothetical protein